MISNDLMKRLALVFVILTIVSFIVTLINMLILLIHNPLAIFYVLITIILSYIFVWLFGNCWRYYDHKETYEGSEGDIPDFKPKLNVFQENYISRTC